MTEYWTASFLEERCAFYRNAFLQDGTATERELLDYWPGGPENPEEGRDGWTVAYGRCLWLLGRQIGREEASRPDTSTAEAALLAALRGDPHEVELVAKEADGAPRYLQVHPKSERALAQCAERDYKLAMLGEAFRLVESLPPAEGSDLHARLLSEIAYQHRVLVWIVCWPGPTSPVGDDLVRPDPPDWTAELDPLDIYHVCSAHQRVNGRRLGLLSALVAQHPNTGARPSWATIAAGAATQLGISSRSLLRDWSLEGWLAQLHLDASAKREAAEAAKRKVG